MNQVGEQGIPLPLSRPVLLLVCGGRDGVKHIARPTGEGTIQQGVPMSRQQRLADWKRWGACAGWSLVAMLCARMTAAAPRPATRPVGEPPPWRDEAAGKAASVLLVTRGNFFLERGV